MREERKTGSGATTGGATTEEDAKRMTQEEAETGRSEADETLSG